jgi:hypothetical protein
MGEGGKKKIGLLHVPKLFGNPNFSGRWTLPNGFGIGS